MSTFTSEPGTRLGGRYRLEDRRAAASGWSAWKAIDEILARPVSVITFAAGFPRLQQAVTAARAASRLTDTRLTQVFDVEDNWDHAYIVLEWPVGETLADMVAGGPVDPLAGARIVAEAASALSAAHAAGLAHLCLQPDSVRWTASGGVKVTGLGIDAALAGISAEDPELADTRGLGQLLYATLTGLWPGPDSAGLPSAPVSDGLPRRPRQVRAGVPTALDEVASRALALPGRDAQQGFASPQQVAQALNAAIPPVPVPPAAPRDLRRDADRQLGQRQQSQYRNQVRGNRSARGSAPQPQQFTGSVTGASQVDTGRDHGPVPPSGPRSSGRLAAIVLAVVVVVAGAGAAAMHLLTKSPQGSHPPSRSSSRSSGNPAAHATPIALLWAHGFDAFNPADTGDENTNQAENVLDGNPAGWSTQQYKTASFGDLKPGTGMILDLGKPARVNSVTVRFGSAPGADVQIRLGNSDDRSAANLDSMTTVASATDVSGSYTFTVHSTAVGQYLVIWFTQLPRQVSGRYPFMAQIFSVSVDGSS
jgi:serine/threonine protein kinase